MFNNKCKIWREGDEIHAQMTLPTPTGPVEWQDSVKADVDDKTALRRMQDKVRFVAGFIPTEELVGADVIEIAEDLFRQHLDPSTVNGASAQVAEIVRRADEGDDDDAYDLGYVLGRMARTHAEKLGFLGSRGLFRGAGIRNVFLPPPDVFKTVYDAKRGDPAAQATLTDLAKLAAGHPVGPGSGRYTIDMPQIEPATPPTPEIQTQAISLLTDLDQAAAIQDQAQADTGDPTAYDPEVYEDWSEETEDVAGLLDAYKRGTTDGLVSSPAASGLVRFIMKVLGRFPTMRSKPVVAGMDLSDPALDGSLKLLQAAEAGHPDAVDKVNTIEALSEAGVPKAQEASEALHVAAEVNKLVGKKPSWMPSFSSWFRGATA